jgi:hypothetical protein
MKPCKFNVGDEADLSHTWDRSERPVNRMGRCLVVSIERGVSESGWLVKLRSLDRKDRAELILDSNWPTKVDQQMELG